MSTQSTQYNKVQGPYDELRKGTITIVERVNVRSVVIPFIKNATVLDLACGTGLYAHTFLKWGASKVVGVDISSAMLAKAKALGDQNGDSDKLKWIEADCSKPTEYEGGPFDIVFGGWLLNYASTGKEMVEFWKNIYMNLKPGCHFVGITPPPSDDPKGHYDKECSIRPWPIASSGLYSTVKRTVDEGVYIHRHADTAAGPLDFETYHLRKDVWIAAAREAGFDGDIEWDGVKIPDDFMENPGKYGEERNGGAGDEELASYRVIPHCGVIHVKK